MFGDDTQLAVHTAKTSSIGEGDYPVFEFTTGSTYAVNNPETGVLRVTMNGDWTNAGTISGDIAVFSLTEPVAQFTSEGKINHGQTLLSRSTFLPAFQLRNFVWVGGRIGAVIQRAIWISIW